MTYLYMIECLNGRYYTGITDDLGRRTTEHKKGRGARYIKRYKYKQLVYVEEYLNRSLAMQAEKRFKKLSHQQKKEIIQDKQEKEKKR